MFNLSPTQQFLIQKGLQAVSGQGQGQPGQQGMMPQAMPRPMMQRPIGQNVPMQSNSGQMGMPAQPGAGNINPAIMARFRSMIMNKLPPQMTQQGPSQMMPPQ